MASFSVKTHQLVGPKWFDVGQANGKFLMIRAVGLI